MDPWLLSSSQPLIAEGETIFQDRSLEWYFLILRSIFFRFLSSLTYYVDILSSFHTSTVQLFCFYLSSLRTHTHHEQMHNESSDSHRIYGRKHSNIACSRPNRSSKVRTVVEVSSPRNKRKQADEILCPARDCATCMCMSANGICSSFGFVFLLFPLLHTTYTSFCILTVQVERLRF